MHELVGLRTEDIDPALRAARDGLVAVDPEAARDQAFSEEIGELLARDRDHPGTLTADAIRSRARSRRPVGWRSIGAVAAAAALLLWLPIGDTERDKGRIGSAPEVHLSVVVDGPRGPHPLAGPVRSDESLVFFTTVTQPGQLVIREVGGQTLFGATGSSPEWLVPAGEHVPGGDTPLAWRPDHPVRGSRTYEARLCNADGQCAADRVEVVWQP